MKKRYINGKWIDLRKEEPSETFYVQGDVMPATKHPVTGKYFESKSAFRKVTKELGYVEIGNDLDPITTDSAKEKKAMQEFLQRTSAYLDGENADRVREINQYILPRIKEKARKR